MAGLSISSAWEETRAIFARDGKLLLTVAAALFLLPQVVVGLINGETATGAPNAGSPWVILFLIMALIGLVGQLAVARLAAGPAISVGEAMGHGLRRLPAILGAVVLLLIAASILAVLIAMLLALLGILDISAAQPSPRDVLEFMVILMIPLFYFAVRLLPTTPVASLEAAGPIAIIRRSWDLTRGHWLRLAGFLLLFIIAALLLLGAAGLITGVLITAVLGQPEPMSLGALLIALLVGIVQAGVTLVYIVMLTRIYLQLVGADVETSVPSSGT